MVAANNTAQLVFSIAVDRYYKNGLTSIFTHLHCCAYTIKLCRYGLGGHYLDTIVALHNLYEIKLVQKRTCEVKKCCITIFMLLISATAILHLAS